MEFQSVGLRSDGVREFGVMLFSKVGLYLYFFSADFYG